MCLMGLLVLASGCAQTVPPRYGPDLTLSPVTDAITVSPTENSFADQVAADFIALHWSTISTQGADLIWHTQKGKEWVKSIQRALLAQGVDAGLIHLSQASASKSGADFTFSSTSYMISAKQCEKDDVYNLGENEHGCTLETLRWSSMVNPQKMIGD